MGVSQVLRKRNEAAKEAMPAMWNKSDSCLEGDDSLCKGCLNEAIFRGDVDSVADVAVVAAVVSSATRTPLGDAERGVSVYLIQGSKQSRAGSTWM